MRRVIVLITLLIIGLSSLETGTAQRRNPRFNAPDFFQVRTETHIGCSTQGFSYSSGKVAECINEGASPEYQYNLIQAAQLQGQSLKFVDVPRMASRFVASQDDTVVAITFSAENLVMTIDEEPLFIRMLVDGQEAAPGSVKLTTGFRQTKIVSQSFTFTATVNKGIHIAQMQWSSEATMVRSYLRGASLLVAVDSQDQSGHRVVTKAERPRTPLSKGDTSWTAIPQAELNFNAPDNGEVALTFSGVVKMYQGDFMLLRAIIDDGAIEASPASITLAGRAYYAGARSVTFTVDGIGPGAHNVRFEWRSSATDVVATATLEAWSATALTGPRQTTNSFFDSVPQTAFASSNSATFEPVPTLTTSVKVDELSDVAVTFSAAFAGTGNILATVMKDGVAVQGQEAILHAPALKCDGDDCNNIIVYDAGAQSYTFSLKDLAPRDEPYEISVAYRVVQMFAVTVPSGSVYEGVMTVLRKTRVGPDLAVGANMGAASSKREAIIEPVHGERKILAIIFDPGRPDAPKLNREFTAGIDEILFGAAPSAADYYKVVSGDRFNLERVAVMGPYRGDKAGGATSENHYWDNAAHDPNGDGDCSDSVDEFNSPFGEQLAEALKRADAEFDFSQYDIDRDGVIAPSELGIIIITPQYSHTGSNTITNFNPYCNGDPFIVDGVEIRYLLHMYTSGIIVDPDPEGPMETPEEARLDSSTVTAHELAHLLLGLDDAYGPYDGIYNGADPQPCNLKSDPDCQRRHVNTAPTPISMMTHKTIRSSPHLDGFHKLQLGWATPRVIVEAGNYSLLDVRQSGDVFILPRRGTDGREYILLETRYEADLFDDPLYDFGLGDDGLAVYHVIEPGLACQAQSGATLPDCVPLRKPMCITSDVVWDSYLSNFLRPGLRLIQPDLTHQRVIINGKPFTDFGSTLFGTVSGVDLLDAPAKGGEMKCPLQIGDPLPTGGAPLLLWADGAASGYRLKGITLDKTARKVLFKAEINGQ